MVPQKMHYLEMHAEKLRCSERCCRYFPQTFYALQHHAKQITVCEQYFVILRILARVQCVAPNSVGGGKNHKEMRECARELTTQLSERAQSSIREGTAKQKSSTSKAQNGANKKKVSRIANGRRKIHHKKNKE